MEFAKHPSMKMVELFNERPFQGQIPEKAKILFLSSDANYSPEISDHPFFECILEYQADGVAFWKRYGYHHPFLLPNYPFNKNKGGVPFHRNFNKIGLNKEHAEFVSFLELLDVPTIGNKSQNRKEFFDLLSLPHLKKIDNLISQGEGKLLLIPGGVLQDMYRVGKKYPIYQWIDRDLIKSKMYVKEINGNRIKKIFHFSSYQIHSQIEEISNEINEWLSGKFDGAVIP